MNPGMAGVGVRCESVVKIYQTPTGEVVALRGVDLEVEPGEFVSLLGPSGAGKSTVMSLLAGITRPSAGGVWVGERNVTRLSERELLALRKTQVGVVLQDPGRNLLPYATVRDNVRFAQRGVSRRVRASFPSAPALLDDLGMGALLKRTVATLSGGEQQRVAIAVGVAHRPGLLLVDEPTSQVDGENRQRVLDVLRTVNTTMGTTVLVVTHDRYVAEASPRTVTIRDGRVGEEGRLGKRYAVVGADGAVQLPPHVLERLPPGTLVEVVPHEAGADLRDEGAT